MKIGIHFFCLVIVSIFLSACSGVKYLQQDEKWLYKQELEGVETANKTELLQQITLRPNTRIPIIGPLGASIYEKGKRNFDSAGVLSQREKYISRIDQQIASRDSLNRSTTKLENKKRRKLERFEKALRQGNLAMRTGTPLSIYDSTEIENSRIRLEGFLKNKGYRNANVDVELKEKGQKAFQSFIIEEGERSYIDSIKVRSTNPLILALLEDYELLSYLKKGDYLDRRNIELERDRIDLLLRDHGYFEFNRQYIEFNVFYAPNQTDLWVETIINDPAEQEFHKYYKLDSIIVNTNGNLPIDNTNDFFGIKYNYGPFDYSSKVLDSRLKISPLQDYSYTDAVNTQKQLLNMDIFRFVNINFDTTIVEGKFVANIYTAPLQRFQLTQELGVNVNEGFPGPFYNLSLRNRNTFQGSEIFQFNAFVGAEGVSAATEQGGLYRSLQYGGSLSLTFPRFMTPFKSRGLNKQTFNPKSRVSLGFAFTDRPEYTRSNLNGTYGYTWQNESGTKIFTLNVADINLINTTRIDPDFQQQLDELALQGNTLELAFNQSFVSSSSFNATFNLDYGNPVTPSTFIRLFLESGGTIYDLVGTGLLTNNNLEFYQFSKFQLDYRRHIPLSEDKSVTLRLNSGVAFPYGDNRTLPYEKFFFTGGSNSNRAWSPRRLGPGSSFPYLLDEFGNNILDENGDLVPNRTGRNSFQFEQPGEVLLEMNAEYRAKIQGFLEWAFFIDAGNIWRFREIQAPAAGEVVRVSEGAQFELNRFYKELAVGTGIGLRLDFSFLVFRLDIGHKLRDPRFASGERWQRLFRRRSQTVWNIAVGLPF